MYRRGDPRWNRTIQNIADNIEHANESTQEHLFTFGQNYVNPCLSSITQCVNACTAPCFPSRDDRRRHRGRSRGRAELSFDFYDDWEEDENDGLLGWGNDNFDRFMGGGSSSYGTVSQPGRQRAMSYGTRNRDNRYNTGRRKSAVQPHDGGPDPTIIPSSSYFGFLGRMPFKLGGKVLRYKPSAADLMEHPGQGRRSLEEGQPLIEDSDEDAGQGSERKTHRRQRSHTSASGNTTDSLSSRGDIFPSEDELDDAVPLDDEFTMALERRTTSQWHDDTSSNKTPRSGSRRPGGSRMSTRTASSRNTQDSSGRKSNDDPNLKRPASEVIEEVDTPSLSDLKQEEERVRLEEEGEVQRKRSDAQQLALRRGLADPNHLSVQTPSRSSSRSRSPHQSDRIRPTQTSPSSNIASPSPSPYAHPDHRQMTAVTTSSPLIRSSSPSPSPGPYTSHSRPNDFGDVAPIPFPTFDEEPQTRPDSGGFHVDESELSSLAPTPNRPLSLRDQPQDAQGDGEARGEGDDGFVPARLPHFGG
ncbi:hypothetical protein K491DRAFT_685487 [Lophiostoma macrostomum CBS 122681]|uniref:Uncharacterized protein n=1 Tax=Lophiostoma macrostomum CBS 122681 TaxID=1314788 RepID=A0A6A6SIS6_9PLEO|nr:hypothetical protein K491DRAFT_685487 [Lophiostoma macrostomum CBS 122681]